MARLVLIGALGAPAAPAVPAALAAVVVALAACSSPGAACMPNDAGLDCPIASAWALGPPIPRPALEPGVATLGQQVVVAGGFVTSPAEGGEITARVDAFDTIVGGWRALRDAPVRWTSINLAAVGSTLYIAGGLEGAARVARGDAFALDPLTRMWRPITAIDPADARGAAGVVTAPGRIYLLGGASSTAALASGLEYDVPQDRWSRLPDLPAPRSHPAAMRMPDGTLIVAGGFASLDASQPRGDVWALPPPGSVPRTWQTRTAMHAPLDRELRGGCAYGVVLGELVCAGGGAGPSGHSTVESYAPYIDAWTVRESLPVERAGTQGAALGSRLFVPGGAETLARDPTDTLYIYTPLDSAPR